MHLQIDHLSTLDIYKIITFPKHTQQYKYYHIEQAKDV